MKLTQAPNPDLTADKLTDHSRSESGVPRLYPWPAITIAAAAFAVVLPFFFWGNASGHDFEFHMFSWMEVLGQWKQGIIYPRWASLAHWGYGEARFLFYPPASWVLGALTGTLFPWKAASGVYIWMALTASGFSMFLLARRWLDRNDAIFAAALYAVNPYYIVVVYWRSAFAELLAGALLPLLLLCVLRMEEDGRRMVIPLSLVVAAAWLTNAPSAVMVNYSLALLVVALAVFRKSSRILVCGGTAVVLGAALAAFYLVPAAYEEKWVNIAQVLAPGVRPQDNFLFDTVNDADHNRFNLLVSILASAEIVVLAAACWLSRKWRRVQKDAWWLLVLWAAASILLMLPLASVFWRYSPELRFIQLPWRWLLCLNVAFALLVSMGLRRWFSRAALCAAMLVIIASVLHHVQPPWWDTLLDIAEMHESVRTGEGYEGTDEYVPAGDDAYEVKKGAPLVSMEGGVAADIRVQLWTAQKKVLWVNVDKPGRLLLRLFNYPAWCAKVNERLVQPQSLSVTGQMAIPLAAGESQVTVNFERTPDRQLGGTISIGTAMLVAGFLAFGRRRKSPRLL